MEQKISFARSGGAFDLTEPNLAAACRAVYSRGPEPTAVEDLHTAWEDALIAEAHAISDRRSCSFLEAAGRAVRSRPALYKLTRLRRVPAGAPADAEVAS